VRFHKPELTLTDTEGAVGTLSNILALGLCSLRYRPCSAWRVPFRLSHRKPMGQNLEETIGDLSLKAKWHIGFDLE